ncbi:DMT family transporter [Mesorhizobium sp. LHD-90]|uniref:DMT family transporter n=1 Tax=Mesorhizobium sp. LHD-90 TaxID=3071414 RepID=UPI0027E11F81|nr:DMT family transporter [Mesorhizobium sp. LHD-90]MDQ6436848.1 DMT family transporter [Mesorhizobium sp. LHD-90]
MNIRPAPLTEPVSPKRPTDRSFEPLDYGLYALTVVAWSASWFAIELQVGTVPNEVNLVWRFAIATLLMFGWLVVSGGRLRIALADHLRIAALGVLIFSSNFLFFYYGAQYLVSGLLSVVFSLASVINLALAAVVMRERPAGRVLIGGLLGFSGIALMFLPEIGRDGFSGSTLIGLALCLCGTLSFCFGNLISASCYRRGLPIVTTNAWGMLYGTLWSAVLALVQGKRFIIEPTVTYLGSLVFLAVVSTVMAFAAYLTLLNRIGPARAGYATVIFPVFALLISTGLEGYRWTLFALAGLVLVAVGNVLVIRGRR